MAFLYNLLCATNALLLPLLLFTLICWYSGWVASVSNIRASPRESIYSPIQTFWLPIHNGNIVKLISRHWPTQFKKLLFLPWSKATLEVHLTTLRSQEPAFYMNNFLALTYLQFRACRTWGNELAVYLEDPKQICVFPRHSSPSVCAAKTNTFSSSWWSSCSRWHEFCWAELFVSNVFLASSMFFCFSFLRLSRICSIDSGFIQICVARTLPFNAIARICGLEGRGYSHTSGAAEHGSTFISFGTVNWWSGKFVIWTMIGLVGTTSTKP